MNPLLMALSNPALLDWHIQQRLTGGGGVPGMQGEMPQKSNMRAMPGTGGMVEGRETTPMRPIGLPKSFMQEEDPSSEANQMMEQYNILGREQMQEMYPDEPPAMQERPPAHISYPGTREEILARQGQEAYNALSPELTEFGPGQMSDPMDMNGPSNAYEDSQEGMQQNVPPGTQQQDPIASGAQMGSQIAKQSYDESDEERRRALGHAMMQFFSNYASSTNPSNLGSINEAFSPAQKEFSNQTQLALKARQKAEEMAVKEKEMQFDREYKMGMLDVHRQDSATKQNKSSATGGLTDYQYQNLKNGFTERDAKLNENEQAAIDRATKGLVPTSKKHAAIISQKTAEIKKRYDVQRMKNARDAKDFGINIYRDIDDDQSSDVGKDISNEINQALSAGGPPPRRPDGTFDTSKLTPEQKVMILNSG